MKINSTIGLTVLLLAMMSGAGAVSAYFSYQMGSQALKGVSQPEANPTKKLTGQKEASESIKDFTPLDEKKIISQVKTYINRETAKTKFVDNAKSVEKPNTSETKPSPKKQQAVSLPIKTQDQGVTLEVVNVSQQGGYLLLDMNLKNEGSKTIQFLYSFLEMKDEQGRPLSAITEGLPGELPPDGENFTGVIKIPLGLVGESHTLSLNLTDHPDQTLKLTLANIPVER